MMLIYLMSMSPYQNMFRRISKSLVIHHLYDLNMLLTHGTNHFMAKKSNTLTPVLPRNSMPRVLIVLSIMLVLFSIYGRAHIPLILPTLNKISNQQASRFSLVQHVINPLITSTRTLMQSFTTMLATWFSTLYPMSLNLFYQRLTVDVQHS
jgi:hypothetical protein